MKIPAPHSSIFAAIFAAIMLASLDLSADTLRVESGFSQSMRTPEMEGHFARDDALRRGTTGTTRGSFNSPWAGNGNATLPLRLEYDRRPDRGNAVVARFRFAEYHSNYRYSSFGTNRFRSRSIQILSTHEVADHRSSDQDLEAGWRHKINSDFFVLPFAGLRLHRMSGKRKSRSFGRGVLGIEEKTVFGFTDPDHSRFSAEAFGPVAGVDAEWRQGDLTLLAGLRLVQISGAYRDSNVSLLYNAGLGANYFQGRFSASSAGYNMSGVLLRLGGRYAMPGPVSLTLELQQENYALALADFTGLDLVSSESLIVAGVPPETETKLFPVDRTEFLYDSIFYAEPRPVAHTTAFLGVSVRIDTSPATTPRRPTPPQPEERQPKPAGPRDTAGNF